MKQFLFTCLLVACLFAGCSQADTLEKAQPDKQGSTNDERAEKSTSASDEIKQSAKESNVHKEKQAAPKQQPPSEQKTTLQGLELPEMPDDVQLVPVDLSPYELFLTIDLPETAQLTNSPVFTAKYEEDGKLHVLTSDEIEAMEEAEGSLREDKTLNVIVDTPRLLIAGTDLGSFSSYMCFAHLKIEDEQFLVVANGVSKRLALSAAASANTLRRTKQNTSDEKLLEESVQSLNDLGCKFKSFTNSIELTGDKFSDEDAALLANIPMLHWLEIGESKTTPKCLSPMAELSVLRNVQFSSPHIDEAWFSPLREYKRLEQLVISDATIGEDDWKILGELKQLQELRIDIPVGRTCLQAIGELPKLYSIELTSGGITDEMLAALKISSEQVWTLDLSDNPITDAGLKHLYRLSNVETFVLDDCKVTQEGIDALKKALPKSKVDFE